MTPVLGYWRIRGLAAPIRLLLEQAQVEYAEKHYDCGPAPHFERPEWLGDKFKLGLDFPNLPYYLDAEVKLSQSRVIMRHLARKHQLDGATGAERIRADLGDTQAQDYYLDYARVIANNRNFAKHKPAYLATLRERLDSLAKFLGDRKFVAGARVTYADFTLFEFLESQRSFQPDAIEGQPRLQEFVERVNELVAVKSYFTSSRAIKQPFFGAPAFVDGLYSRGPPSTTD